MSISANGFGIISILIMHDRRFDASSWLDINFELLGRELRRATKFDGDTLNDHLFGEDEALVSAELEEQILRQERIPYASDYAIFFLIGEF